MITVTTPIRVVNELNAHTHWRVRAKRAKAQHIIVAAYLRCAADSAANSDTARATFGALAVTMVRLSPRSYDSDGTTASMKHVRDAIAKWLGRDDGPKAGVRWTAAWERSKEVGVRITIEADAQAVAS